MFVVVVGFVVRFLFSFVFVIVFALCLRFVVLVLVGCGLGGQCRVYDDY